MIAATARSGAMLARGHVIPPLVENGKVFRHGITFGGHSDADLLDDIVLGLRDVLRDAGTHVNVS